MTATALAKHATPLRDVFERYHVGWETKNPDLIASLHSEDTVFHIHDGSDAVHGRQALRQRCSPRRRWPRQSSSRRNSAH